MVESPYRPRHRRLMDTAPAAAISSDSGHSGSNGGMPIMVSILVVVIICTLCYCVYCWRWRKRNAVKRTEIERLRPLSNSDLPVMDLSLIQAATNNFSKENKLGEGGENGAEAAPNPAHSADSGLISQSYPIQKKNQSTCPTPPHVKFAPAPALHHMENAAKSMGSTREIPISLAAG